MISGRNYIHFWYAWQAIIKEHFSQDITIKIIFIISMYNCYFGGKLLRKKRNLKENKKKTTNRWLNKFKLFKWMVNKIPPSSLKTFVICKLGHFSVTCQRLKRDQKSYQIWHLNSRLVLFTSERHLHNDNK